MANSRVGSGSETMPRWKALMDQVGIVTEDPDSKVVALFAQQVGIVRMIYGVRLVEEWSFMKIQLWQQRERRLKKLAGEWN